MSPLAPCPVTQLTQSIQHHIHDLKACQQVALECRHWAQVYLEAAEAYEQAASHAAQSLRQSLTLKWALEGGV